MGKKMQKRTKKFVKNSLERTVKVRRQKQKFARKDATRAESRKARADQQKSKEAGDEDAAPKKKIEELDVDEFLEGKFFASEDESGDDNAIDQVDEGDELEEKALDDDDEGDDGEDSDIDMGGMDEAAFHKMQLEALKKNDPEFYKHLEQHDKSLLDFKVGDEDDDEEDGEKPAAQNGKDKPKTIMDVIGRKQKESKSGEDKKEAKGQKGKSQMEVDEEEEEEEEEDNEGDEGDDEEDDEAPLPPQPKKKKKAKVLPPASELTLGQLKKLKEQLLAHSKSALKQLLRAFRAAAHISDDAKEGSEEKFDVTFANSKVFNNVIRVSFQMIPAEFQYRLGSKHEGSLKSNPNWSGIEPLVRSYLGNLVHFVSKVLDITMIRLVLAHMEQMVAYFEPFHKLALKFLKGLLGFWSTSEEDVRIDAFLRIRQLVLTLSDKSQLLEHALKGIYLTFVRHSNFASRESMPTLNFMANCVVELYSLEPVSSYQHGFVYIRQLAIHLRNAIHAKTKEAHRGVYNWKYVSCLRVWTLLLTAHGSKPDSYLYPLVYPLVQVCIGVLDLLPSSRYLPLRFNVIRTLNKLAEATNTYIPLGSYLMDAVHTALQTKKPKKSMGAPPTFQYVLKVTKATAASKGYQTAVVNEAMSLLLKHLSIYSYSVAFPELAIPIQLFMKREKKACTIARLKKPISQFIVKVEANMQYIVAQRAAIEYTPQDAVNPAKKTFKQLILERDKNAVSPLEKFVKLQGAEETDGEGRLLSAQEMQHESRSRKHKGDSDEEDDDAEDDEEDEEEEQQGEGEEGDEGDNEEDAQAAEDRALIAKEVKKRQREAAVSKVMSRADDPADHVEDFVLSESDDDVPTRPFSKQPAKKILTTPQNVAQATKKSPKGPAQQMPKKSPPAQNGPSKQANKPSPNPKGKPAGKPSSKPSKPGLVK